MAVLSNTGIRAGASGVVADAYTVKRSARFDRASSAYMNWTPSAAGNRKTWTMSMWVKRNKTGAEYQLFGQHLNQNTTDRVQFYFGSSDQLYVHSYSLNLLITNRLFRDVGAWYHIVLTYDTTTGTAGDRIRLYINGVRETSFATETQPSMNVDLGINTTGTFIIGSDITALGTYYLDNQLADINFIDGISLAGTDFGETDSTTGQWVPKEYSGSYGTNGFHLAMDPANGGTNYSQYGATVGINSSYPWSKAFDGITDGTYGNGAGAVDGAGYIKWEPASAITVSSSLRLNTDNGTPAIKVNGSAVTTSDGWTTISGISSLSSIEIYNAGSDWTYLCGVEVDGKVLIDHSSIGYDSSGNNNHWHENNLFGNEHTTANENFKTVLYEGNDGTTTVNVGFQPDLVWIKGIDETLGHNLYDSVRGDYRIMSDRPDAESAWTALDITSTGFTIADDAAEQNKSGKTYVAWCWKAANANTSVSAGDLNSVSYNQAATWSNDLESADDSYWSGNVPTGAFDGNTATFMATANLGTTTFDPSTDVPITSSFEVYQPAGSVGSRTQTWAVDGATLVLTSATNGTWVSGPNLVGKTISASTPLTVTIGAGSGEAIYFGSLKIDGKLLVDSGVTTANVPSLASTQSANTTAGFSIVKWNSSSSVSTVAHGLGKVPKMIITKNLDASNTWWTYHEGTGNTHAMRLDTTDAKTDQSSNWNDTSPTSSVFTVGGEWGNGNDVIAYCFADVEGHSKFSTYTGSGSSGNKIATGFCPAFVMVKRTTNISGSHMGWSIVDGRRGSTQKVQANSTASENDGSINGGAGTDDVTFQPDGFTLASSSSASNGSGETYIYAAFAGHPAGDLDLLADTPAPYDNELNGGGNYATLNTLNRHSSSNDSTSNGNLKAIGTSGSANLIPSTIAFSSGKYYYEVKWSDASAPLLGIRRSDSRNYDNMYAYHGDGNKYTNGGSATGYGATYTTGDIIGCAVDMDAGTIKFYKNGADQGQAFSGISGEYTFCQGVFGGTTSTYTVNFGQRAFAYTPPTGYKALNVYNLSDPTITKGNTGFDILAYTGDGAATRTLTGLEFDPDMIWLKNRSQAVDHNLWDEVRGMGVNKEIVPNDTYTEGETGAGKPNTDAWGFIHDTTSDGFIVKEGTSGASVCNTNSSTYVAWAWDAGTANVSKAAGDLNSSAYNQSETWSGYTATGSHPAGADWDYAFNGNVADGCYSNTDVTATLTIDVSDRPTWSSQIRIHGVRHGSGLVKVNGTTVSTAMTDGSTGWWDLTSTLGSSGTFASLELTNPGGNYGKINAVELDGVLLVDSGVTVTNVPSIASTYRVNTNTGFSVATFTASGSAGSDNIAHGLNAKPDFVTIKRLDSADDWYTWHSSFGNQQRDYILLNTTGAKVTSGNDSWGDGMTSNVVGFRSQGTAAGNMVVYAWSEVSGYSKFSSYTGNGSTDGTFVWCGFKPAYWMSKRTDSGAGWKIFDSARSPFNVVDDKLEGAATTVEQSGSWGYHDFTSNGVKIRTSDADFNASGGTYIFAAFAETPFKYNNAH